MKEDRLKKVINKYFHEEKVRYYTAPDLIADDHYLRYEFHGDRVILIVGCQNGEVPIKVLRGDDYKEFENLIKMLLY